MNVEAELGCIRRKLEENHMDPNSCAMQTFSEIEIPPSLSGQYFHLPGPISEVFRQRVVVSVALPHVRVLYAFCKTFKLPSSLKPEILNLILQINARLSDCVVIFKPTKKQNLYLKLTLFIEGRVEETALGTLFWKALVVVTEKFREELGELAMYFAGWEKPPKLYPRKEVPKLSAEEMRTITSGRRPLEAKAREELIPERLPENASVYHAPDYFIQKDMGVLHLLNASFESYSRLCKKGIRLLHPLSSYLFSEAFPRLTALSPCDFENVPERTLKPEDFYEFLDYQDPGLLSPNELYRVFALSKVTFPGDLIVTKRDHEFVGISLATDRSYRMMSLFPANVSFRLLAYHYFLWTKAWPRLTTSETVSDGVVLCPYAVAADSWNSIPEGDQLILKSWVWGLMDARYFPMATLAYSLLDAKRVELTAAALPKIVMELGHIHKAGLAHLRITPQRVLLELKSGEAFLVGATFGLGGGEIDTEELQYMAPELLAAKKGWASGEEKQKALAAADVFSLAMTLHAFLFPGEVLHYESREVYLRKYCEEFRRPYIPNEFEREYPEFTDVLRRSWEDLYRPELSEFKWK